MDANTKAYLLAVLGDLIQSQHVGSTYNGIAVDEAAIAGLQAIFDQVNGTTVSE